MKVALVQGPYQDAVYETISMPLGLCWISAYLKEKMPDVHVDGFDLLLRPTLEETLYESVAQEHYDIVGIQAHSDMTVLEVIRIINRIKEIRPETNVVVGGNAATYLAEVLFRSSAVDIVLKGEGDITFCEIAQAIRYHQRIDAVQGLYVRTGAKIVETEDRALIEDLDKLPLPDRSIFDQYVYPQYGVMMSRGCPYHCAFCSTSAFWKNRVRFRNAPSVIDEIRQLKRDYAITKLFILDDSFGINEQIYEAFLIDLACAHLGIEWACVARADVVSEHMLDLCKAAGCVEIHFGLDSANEKTQILINKNLNIRVLTERCRYAKKIGIRTKLSVILGLPEETEEDILNTIGLLKELRPNEIQIYPLMPYVGTELFLPDGNKGVELLEEDFSKWRQDAFRPVIQTKYLTQDDIIRIAEQATKIFGNIGYKCIPFDMEPVKRNEPYIVKTMFAPLQAL